MNLFILAASVVVLSQFAAQVGHANAALAMPLSGVIAATMNQEAQKLQTAKSLAPQKTISECADFRGSWTGSCKVGEESKEVTFKIEQDGCKSLKIDDSKLVFNNSKAESDANIFLFANTHWTSKLSEDGKAVKLYGAFLMNSPFFPDAILGSGAALMTRDGENLKVDGKFRIAVGTKDSGDAAITCDLAAR